MLSSDSCRWGPLLKRAGCLAGAWARFGNLLPECCDAPAAEASLYCPNAEVAPPRAKRCCPFAAYRHQRLCLLSFIVPCLSLHACCLLQGSPSSAVQHKHEKSNSLGDACNHTAVGHPGTECSIATRERHRKNGIPQRAGRLLLLQAWPGQPCPQDGSLGCAGNAPGQRCTPGAPPGTRWRPEARCSRAAMLMWQRCAPLPRSLQPEHFS